MKRRGHDLLVIESKDISEVKKKKWVCRKNAQKESLLFMF